MQCNSVLMQIYEWLTEWLWRATATGRSEWMACHSTFLNCDIVWHPIPSPISVLVDLASSLLFVFPKPDGGSMISICLCIPYILNIRLLLRVCHSDTPTCGISPAESIMTMLKSDCLCSTIFSLFCFLAIIIAPIRSCVAFSGVLPFAYLRCFRWLINESGSSRWRLFGSAHKIC